MRTCTKCHFEKPDDLFRNKYWCKTCMSQAQANWKKRNRTHVNLYQKKRKKINPKSFTVIRRRSTLKQYGLTITQFESLLNRQNSRCAICSTDKPGGFANQWAVDHCHKTGGVRGILCSSCNKGLGHFKDNIAVMETAVRYLTFFHRPTEVLGI